MTRKTLTVPLSPAEKEKLERLTEAEAMPGLAATVRRLIMLAPLRPAVPTHSAQPGSNGG